MTSVRKGASRVADVPRDILGELNAGRIEAATLPENLATDFSLLLRNVLPETAAKASGIDPKAGITKRMSEVADLIVDHHGDKQLDFLMAHQSDLVRGWGAYVLARLPDMSLAERIERMRPFADDTHFGVREWAWLALRPNIVRDPMTAINLLESWTDDSSDNIRRFAIEATRPRCVWSAHISELKADPSPASSLLAPVCSDPSRYVQDLVANWLNDAWKSRPDWVEATCRAWAKTRNTKQTRYIVRRALRNKAK